MSRYENNIDITEPETVSFCHNKTASSYIVVSSMFPVLIGPDTTNTKPGEMIEISAGVGSYSTGGDPRIKINGIAASLSNGVADYQFKASGKLGKHSIQVTIDFNHDGNNLTFAKNIYYSTD